MTGIDHIRGETVHIRHGGVKNAFRYGVDYVLIDPEAAVPLPRLMSRNRANLLALHDRDHGGPPGRGRGSDWVRDVLRANGVTIPWLKLELLTQPRVMGHVFNPVSFWLCRDGTGALLAVIAEVSNTFGDRHSYLCHHDDLRPIRRDDRLVARKVFHVSPFQDIGGEYHFRFDIGAAKVGIWIDFRDGQDGVFATLTGTRAPLTNRAILGACLRRPFGSRRVLALIHWQALKLFLKGARYRARSEPPAEEVTR